MPNKNEELIRRRKERKRRIRRRRIFVTVSLLLIIGLTVGIIACFTVLFKAENVTAKATRLYTAEELVKASRITSDDNILTLNTSDITENIRLQLPFADEIKISRKLPDTVVISAKDAKEYLFVSFENSYYTVSKKGYALAHYDEKPNGIFEIKCDLEEPTLGKKLSIKDAIQADNLSEIIKKLSESEISINCVDVISSISLKATVDGRFIVDFGGNTNLDKKIAHLAGMVSGISEEKTGKINLSMWSGDKTQGSFVEGSIDN